MVNASARIRVSDLVDPTSGEEASDRLPWVWRRNVMQ